MTTLVEYTGDGSTTDWNFSFTYLADDYVVFSVVDTGDVDVSNTYTGELVAASTLRITPAVPSGYSITVYRASDVTDDLFGFGAGGVMRPSDISFAMKSVRDYAEEARFDGQSAAVDLAATQAETYATNAAASAAAAATSATNAGTSETNAGTSETNAAASAAAAATSASNAATSETNAGTSETNAAASASAASTSATNAGTSETNAAASASAASTSETNAGTSETNAAASASAASTSETNAAASASAAATSAGNAGTSESNAAGSATAASNSASAASTSETNAASSASAAATSATNAQNALDSLNNRYLGAHASDSAVATYVSGDPDITLDEGDLYFNTTDEKLLYYTTASGWLAAAATNVINADNLTNVGNVTITSATSGDILRWNGTQWVNYADSNYATSAQGALADSATQPGDLATVATSGAYSDLTGQPTIPANIGDLGDVTITAGATGEVLRFNGTVWVDATLDYSDLSGTPSLATVATSGSYSDLTGTPTIPANVGDLGDVTITAAATGEVLRYNGSAWVDATLAYTDLSGTPSLATVATSGAYSDLTGTPTFGNIPQNSQTSAYVLVAGDAGKHISITTGGVTVNTSVFSTGDAVTIFNNSGSDQTITQGTSVTLYLAGDGGTGNKTLAGYGLATLLCVGTNTFVISGVGLS